MARTAEFDRQEVLQRALDIFWQEGYCKCSVARLVEATGLKPGSLYAAFGSKEGLFLAALEFYGRQSVRRLQACLDSADSPLQGIRTFIDQIGERVLNREQQRGCFLVNSVLEFSPGREAVNRVVETFFSTIESLFVSALKKSAEAGELPPDQNPAALAKYLLVNIWGLQVLARTNPDEETVQAVLERIIAGLTASD